MMKISTILCVSCCLAAALPPPAPALSAELPTGGELLGRAIAHHDPQSVWGRSPLRLVLEESRPGEGVRATEVTIGAPGGGFSWKSRRAGRELAGRLENGSCTLTLDGSPEISGQERETHGLDCETLVRRRDYYSYLWGLPMKLRDPGTRIDETVTRGELAGREVLALRVTYDEAVGSDVWIFYFDPATSALAGYRFFHDEAANDGEYVILEGEAVVAGMRLPRKRDWYTNRDGEHLGTDTLVGDRSDPAPPVVEPAPELAALAPFLVQEVEAIQEMLPDGRMRVRTRMLRHGAWEERREMIYEFDPDADVVLPVAIGFGGG